MTSLRRSSIKKTIQNGLSIDGIYPRKVSSVRNDVTCLLTEASLILVLADSAKIAFSGRQVGSQFWVTELKKIGFKDSTFSRALVLANSPCKNILFKGKAGNISRT